MRNAGWRYLWRIPPLLLLTMAAAGQEGAVDDLLSRYQNLLVQLAAEPLAAPLQVVSSEDAHGARGEVIALLRQPFNSLAYQLGMADSWCQIALLHLNTKACTSEGDAITLYSGRKTFEPPERAYPLRFVLHKTEGLALALQVELDADVGPLGTHDYRIVVLAIPVPEGSFVSVSYAFQMSVVGRLAMDLYLSTLGHDKLGFTAVGMDAKGRTDYVRGTRGIVERNAVRYYFAVQSFFEGLGLAPAQRFESAIQRWFELTEHYPLQLHEMERHEYLETKRHEFREQTRLQQAIHAVDAGVRQPPER